MKLIDKQTKILTAAAVHAGGLALPPDRLPPAPRQAVGKALLKAGMVATAADVNSEPVAAWTIDGEPTLLRITEAGLAAVGSEAAQETSQTGTEANGAPGGQPTPPRRPWKASSSPPGPFLTPRAARPCAKPRS